jgi:hypothetical protein
MRRRMGRRRGRRRRRRRKERKEEEEEPANQPVSQPTLAIHELSKCKINMNELSNITSRKYSKWNM